MSETDPLEGMTAEEVRARIAAAASTLTDPTDPALLAGALHREGLVTDEQAARIFRAPRHGEEMTAQQVLDVYDAAPLGVFNGVQDPETGELVHASATVVIPTPEGEFLIQTYGCCRPMGATLSMPPSVLFDFSAVLYEMTHQWVKIDLADEDTWPDVDAPVLVCHAGGQPYSAGGATAMTYARCGVEVQWRPMPKSPDFQGEVSGG